MPPPSVCTEFRGVLSHRAVGTSWYEPTVEGVVDRRGGGGGGREDNFIYYKVQGYGICMAAPDYKYRNSP